MMGKPQTNGIIELVDEKSQDRGFFCMQLVAYLGKEAKPGTSIYAELWDLRFTQAKNHRCAYMNKCPIFARTQGKKPMTPVQLTLDFEKSARK